MDDTREIINRFKNAFPGGTTKTGKYSDNTGMFGRTVHFFNTGDGAWLTQAQILPVIIRKEMEIKNGRQE